MPNKVGISINKSDERKLVKKIQSLRQLGGDPDFIISNAIRKTSKIAKKNATNMGAYDTGRLRRGIHVERVGKGSYALVSEAIDPETGADYAPVVHDGLARTGKNSRARPYLREAVRTLPGRIKYALDRAVRSIIQKGTFNKRRESF